MICVLLHVAFYLGNLAVVLQIFIYNLIYRLNPHISFFSPANGKLMYKKKYIFQRTLSMKIMFKLITHFVS